MEDQRHRDIWPAPAQIHVPIYPTSLLRGLELPTWLTSIREKNLYEDFIINK